MSDTIALQSKAITIGKLAVQMTTVAGSGHPSTALSLAHLVSVLMYEKMQWDPKDPWNAMSDRLVLSEGHAVPIVYGALIDQAAVYGTKDAPRMLTLSDADTLRKVDSLLDGHPNPAIGMPFFDAATGSLGQGLSVAAGLALAAELNHIPKQIFCLMGDGESREGQIWEAFDFIADQKLMNVRAIFNCNGQGQADYVSHQQEAEMLAKKVEAFGWKALIIDGHDVHVIQEAFNAPATDKPICIVAKTIKGWGVNALQAKGNHGKPLKKDQLEQAMKDLDSELEKVGAVGDGHPRLRGDRLEPSLRKGHAHVRAHLAPFPAPNFDTLLASDSALAGFQKTKTLSTRRAYGLALRELGTINPDVVAVDGDVSNSTFSEYFKFAHPERFFECKIAEQNMVSVAGGLAAGGKIPFASTFGKFFSRAFDQIEMCVISGHNLKLVGSHSGVSLGPDGPSQMAVTDLPFFRSFPRNSKLAGRRAMTVLNPADAYCAYYLTEWMANHEGPAYMRTMRSDLPLLYPDDETFEVPGAKVLATGKDLLIVATGYMVHTALSLLPQLKEQGISAGLIDCYTFPAPIDLIFSEAKKSENKILTLEDNYPALREDLAVVAAHQGGPIVHGLAVKAFAKSAQTAEEVFEYVGLGPKEIIDACKAIAK